MSTAFKTTWPRGHAPADGCHLSGEWRAACLRDAGKDGPGMVPRAMAACRDASPDGRGWAGARAILQPDGKILFHDGTAWGSLTEDLGWW